MKSWAPIIFILVFTLSSLVSQATGTRWITVHLPTHVLYVDEGPSGGITKVPCITSSSASAERTISLMNSAYTPHYNNWNIPSDTNLITLYGLKIIAAPDAKNNPEYSKSIITIDCTNSDHPKGYPFSVDQVVEMVKECIKLNLKPKTIQVLPKKGKEKKQDRAKLSKANFAGYMQMGYSNDQPEGYQWGAFHYTNVHTLMPLEDNGRYFQSGLFHTWYAPDVKGNREQIGYHKIEGGPGYKPYLRFISKTTPQKFTMGGVAGGFGSYSNGPGQGSPAPHRGDWDDNRGRYGAAQLSNSLLFPLDGLNIENGTENEMFGYGYYALPLTEPKTVTAGKNVPTGNHCWTLFFNTETFSGPVAFYTPYHWSKYTLDEKNAHMRGKTFDNNIFKKGRSLSMETQKTLGKRWIAPNGDKYYRVVPMTFPLDKDGLSRKGAMVMSFNKNKWQQMNTWFNGGKIASTDFSSEPDSAYIGKFNAGDKGRKGGGAGWRFFSPDTDGDGPMQKEKIPVDTTSFMTSVQDSPATTHAIKWSGDLIKKRSQPNLVSLPEFYKLSKNSKKAIPIHKNEIPKESGLLELKSKSQYQDFFQINHTNTKPLSTPLHPDYTKSGPVIDSWTIPGPTAGPFTVNLGDGSTAVYYWYKFNEQPSILNSDMGKEERDLIQKRVELMHQHWSKSDQYFPRPNRPIAAVDPGLLVTPPKGLEVGYVPICVHQQLTKEQLPKFRIIKHSNQ